MAITVTCECGKLLEIGEEYAGKQGRCPICRNVVNIPLGMAMPILTLDDPLPLPVAEPVPAMLPQDELVFDSPGECRKPRYGFYSPMTAACAALAGGFLGGGLLLASNYRRLGREAAAWAITLLGALGTLGVFILVYNYAEPPPRLGAVYYLVPLFLGQQILAGLVVWGLGRFLQGGIHAKYVGSGGKTTPFRSVLAPCIAWSAVILFLQALTTYPLTWGGSGGNVVFENNQRVFFHGDATQAEGEKYGRFLLNVGYFNKLSAIDVVLSRTDDVYTLTFFLALEGREWQDPDVIAYIDEIRREAAQQLFPGKRVEARICDQFNRLKKVVR